MIHIDNDVYGRNDTFVFTLSPKEEAFYNTGKNDFAVISHT